MPCTQDGACKAPEAPPATCQQIGPERQRQGGPGRTLHIEDRGKRREQEDHTDDQHRHNGEGKEDETVGGEETRSRPGSAWIAGPEAVDELRQCGESEAQNASTRRLGQDVRTVLGKATPYLGRGKAMQKIRTSDAHAGSPTVSAVGGPR